MPKTTVNSLVRGNRRSTPHIVKIARELQTTAAYLMGETDDPTSELPDEPALNHDELDMIELLRGLKPADRAALMQLARTIATSAASSSLHTDRRGYRGEG